MSINNATRGELREFKQAVATCWDSFSEIRVSRAFDLAGTQMFRGNETSFTRGWGKLIAMMPPTVTMNIYNRRHVSWATLRCSNSLFGHQFDGIGVWVEDAMRVRLGKAPDGRANWVWRQKGQFVMLASDHACARLVERRCEHDVGMALLHAGISEFYKGKPLSDGRLYIPVGSGYLICDCDAVETETSVIPYAKTYIDADMVSDEQVKELAARRTILETYNSMRAGNA